jgi:hypothetical protein
MQMRNNERARGGVRSIVDRPAIGFRRRGAVVVKRSLVAAAHETLETGVDLNDGIHNTLTFSLEIHR